MSLRQKEGGGEDSPGRSILGLSRVEPRPFRIEAPRNGAPPHATILGLADLEVAPLSRRPDAAARNGEPPNASLLGLSGLDPAPLARLPPRPAGEEPVATSLLGLSALPLTPLPGLLRARNRRVASRAPASFFGLSAPAPRAEEPSPSFFGLVVPGGAAGIPAGEPVDVPEFERDVTHQAERAFPMERAIAASLVAHVLFLLLLLWAPTSRTHDPRKGLLAALVPPERTAEEKIPLVFREAPGPARENPSKSAPSDADRRAGGGDASKPRAAEPLVPQRPGRQGLAPGPRRPRGLPAMPPPGSTARRAPGQPGDRSPAEAKPAAPAEAPAEGALVVPKAGGAPGAKPEAAPAPTLQGLNQAIRDAARGVGAAGEDGAGFPNAGGFVDSGPLSFDTTWYDWGPYAAEMIRRIKLHWDVPNLARLGWKGKLTIRFYILADGSVQGATYLSNSGVPPFDFAAMQAIVTSNPFRPLPKDLLAMSPGKDREGITVTFFYNLRPGESGSGAPN